MTIKKSRWKIVFCLACAFDSLTADLQIQQQLKPTQSDIHIDMDKLVAYEKNSFEKKQTQSSSYLDLLLMSLFMMVSKLQLNVLHVVLVFDVKVVLLVVYIQLVEF